MTLYPYCSRWSRSISDEVYTLRFKQRTGEETQSGGVRTADERERAAAVTGVLHVFV